MNWRRFLQRDQADAEQREELEFYLDVTAEEYIGRGWVQRLRAMPHAESSAARP